MHSLQITGPGKFELVDVAPPRCGSGEVLIRMKACAICNQHDLAVFDGSPHGPARAYPHEPGFPGHEGAGVVVEAAPDVADLKVGDHVVTSGMGGPPLYSEYVTRKADMAVRVAGDIEFVHAAPLELFGCVHRAFTLTRSVEGLRVGVAGLGPGGQAAVALARAFGAAEVVGFDLDASRRDKAMEMGATAVVDAAQFRGAHEAAKSLIAGRQRDSAAGAALDAVEAHQCEVLFECSGSARSMEISFLLAGADLTIFGYVREPAEAIGAVWFDKELLIKSSKILRISDLQAVADLLSQRRIDTRPIITDVVHFRDYAAALERIRQRRAIKIALTWE